MDPTGVLKPDFRPPISMVDGDPRIFAGGNATRSLQKTSGPVPASRDEDLSYNRVDRNERLGRPRFGAHGEHLFAVRTVQARRLASGQAAHQAQLSAVMNAVADDGLPQDLANGHRAGDK